MNDSTINGNYPVFFGYLPLNHEQPLAVYRSYDVSNYQPGESDYLSSLSVEVIQMIARKLSLRDCIQLKFVNKMISNAINLDVINEIKKSEPVIVLHELRELYASNLGSREAYKNAYFHSRKLLSERDTMTTDVKVFLQGAYMADYRIIYCHKFNFDSLFEQAIEMKRHNAINLLMEAFNFKGKKSPALYFAFYRSNVTMFKGLLDHGVNPMLPFYQELWAEVNKNICCLVENWPIKDSDFPKARMDQLDNIIYLIEKTSRLKGGIGFLKQHLDANAQKGGRILFATRSLESPETTTPRKPELSLPYKFSGVEIEGVNTRDILLHLVYKLKNTGMFKILLECGANPFWGKARFTEDPYSPNRLLLVAIEQNDESIIKYLLEKFPTVLFEDEENPVYLSASLDRAELFSNLVERMKNQSQDKARKYLQSCVNKQDKNGFSLLYKSVQNGNTVLAKALLSEGAQPMTDSDSASSYMLAVNNDARELVELIRPYTDDSYRERIAELTNFDKLLMAIEQSDINLLTDLITRTGINPNLSSPEGIKVLDGAVTANNANTVGSQKRPLSDSSDTYLAPRKQTKKGSSTICENSAVLDIALDKGDHKVITSLIVNGAYTHRLFFKLMAPGLTELLPVAINAYKSQHEKEKFLALLTEVDDRDNCFDYNESNLFLYAIGEKRDDIINLLIDDDVCSTLDLSGDIGFDLIMAAVGYEDIDLIKKLVVAGSPLQPPFCKANRKTPFHQLSMPEIKKPVDIFDALFSGIKQREGNNAEDYLRSILDLPDFKGNTAAYYCQKDIFCIKRFLDAGVSLIGVPSEDISLFYSAITDFNSELYDLLTETVKKREGNNADVKLLQWLTQPPLNGCLPLEVARSQLERDTSFELERYSICLHHLGFAHFTPSVGTLSEASRFPELLPLSSPQSLSGAVKKHQYLSGTEPFVFKPSEELKNKLAFFERLQADIERLKEGDSGYARIDDTPENSHLTEGGRDENRAFRIAEEDPYSVIPDDSEVTDIEQNDPVYATVNKDQLNKKDLLPLFDDLD